MKLNPVQLNARNFTNVTFLHNISGGSRGWWWDDKNLSDARAPTTNDLLIMNQQIICDGVRVTLVTRSRLGSSHTLTESLL